MSGGLLGAIFDCLHYRLPVVMGVVTAVTARLEVDYRAPIPIGHRVDFEGTLIARRGRVFETRGVARLAGGTVAAESRAVYVEIPESRLPPASRGGRAASR